MSFVGIRAGELRRRVTFQTRSTAQDSVGGQLTTWTDVATVWAGIEPLGVGERLAAAAEHVDASHTITVRYQALFADPRAVAAMRAVYKGRIFNIVGSMNEEERNRNVVLQVREGLNEG